ncbi:hypothetical protein [Vibrio bathopelagicus]
MEEIQEIYQRVFKVAKYFLDQSNFYTIQELAEHNEPTYDEVARIAKQLAGVLEQMAKNGGWDEERVALNASQAALHMIEMATSIAEQNQENLTSSSERLEKLTFV